MPEKPAPNPFRDNPTAVAAYLSEAFAKNQFTDLVRAIGLMMRAQNVKALSEDTGLRRENLYRMFDGKRDPTLGNTIKVLDSLGVKLVAKPQKAIKAKPARPKLGRPKSVE
jgi:probable addiction module antidote protein